MYEVIFSVIQEVALLSADCVMGLRIAGMHLMNLTPVSLTLQIGSGPALKKNGPSVQANVPITTLT